MIEKNIKIKDKIMNKQTEKRTLCFKLKKEKKNINKIKNISS